jgi:hypothetical protein
MLLKFFQTLINAKFMTHMASTELIKVWVDKKPVGLACLIYYLEVGVEENKNKGQKEGLMPITT